MSPRCLSITLAMFTLTVATWAGAAPAHAQSLRDGKLADWLTDVSHPCHNPLKKVNVDYSKWELAFADEFNGSDGSACYTRPAQCYGVYNGLGPCPAETQRNLVNLNKCTWNVYHFKSWMARQNLSAEDVTVEGGNLVLTSRARAPGTVVPVPQAEDCATSGGWTANCTHSAGAIDSKPNSALSVSGFAQQYGRFEVRAKLPRTPGSWPAHWLMPVQGRWPDDGEIDLMESFDGRSNRASFTLHWADPTTRKHMQLGVPCAISPSRDFTADYHVWAIEWDPTEIRWYVDGYHVNTLSSKMRNGHGSPVFIPKLPFFWILNTSIAMDNAAAVTPATFPVGKHYIDYVRVYRPKGAVATGALWTNALAKARELASQLIFRAKDSFTRLWQAAVDVVRRFSHYVERYDKCVERHVRPFAADAATKVRELAASTSSAFWSALQPSLQGLSPADRTQAVQAPWTELLTSLRQQFSAAREGGVGLVRTWFVIGSHKDSAAQQYRAPFDAGVLAVEQALAAGYRAVVGL